MITLTEQALGILAEYRKRAPQFEWCLHVSWGAGDVETFRLANGTLGWTRGIPNGWVVGIEPYLPELERRYTLFVVSGVKVFLDAKSPPQFPFRGGVVSANGTELYLAP